MYLLGPDIGTTSYYHSIWRSGGKAFTVMPYFRDTDNLTKVNYG
jgi:hypothetical protein